MTGAWLTAGAWLGLAVGSLVGFFVRRARLCSFGAIESALVGHDWRRMKVFGLALAIALAGTQVLAVAGWLDPLRTTYVAARFPWFGVMAGALAFGFGMALVGTCAFGSLIRLGGGDLRSLVALMVFGAVAYAVLRGGLSALRIGIIEQVAVDMPGGKAGMMTALLPGWGLGLAFAIALGLAAVAVTDRRLWKAPKLMTAGVVLGLGVVMGWVSAGVMQDDFDNPARIQSLTFVAPVARALFGLMIGGPNWFDFGVGSVFGVVIGSFAAARRARDFHWEAFDDPLEMRRHLIGAVLMGLGGILAGGCTIGQGLTAGSLTAVSWPVAVPCLMIGARLGILVLVEGSLLSGLRARLAVLTRRGD